MILRAEAKDLMRSFVEHTTNFRSINPNDEVHPQSTQVKTHAATALAACSYWAARLHELRPQTCDWLRKTARCFDALAYAVVALAVRSCLAGGMQFLRWQLQR